MTTTKPRPTAHTTETSTGRNTVPTWAALKTAWKAAEASGVKAKGKAYDTIVRAYALTAETETDTKGTVTARSERSRGREVLDALKVEAGNVFSLTDVRVTQVVKVYATIARAGLDPFSDQGKALYPQVEVIRKNDVGALDKVADAIKAGKPGETKAALDKGVEDAKATAKARREASTPKATTVTVKDLAGVQKFAEGALPMVRKVSATASEEDKAATRKALEALLAHLQ